MNLPLFDLTPLSLQFGSLWIGAALCAGLGLIVGFVGAMFGIGGGFLVTPFLHGVIGVSGPFAVATSMGQIPFVAFSGSARFALEKRISYRHGFLLLAAMIPMSQLTAHYVGRLNHMSWAQGLLFNTITIADFVVLFLYVFVIGGLGLVNLWRARHFERSPEEGQVVAFTPARIVFLLVMGSMTGAISALLGVGGGFFIVPFLLHVCKLSPDRAVATSLFAIFVMSALATLNYLWAGSIYFGISFLIALGGVVGSQLGAKKAMKIAPQTLLLSLGVIQLGAVLLYLFTLCH